jgi:3'-phosphoadenosine 5'-phosphosulfate sulfotransferase (PAPS reductase)/FAD synthetase
MIKQITVAWFSAGVSSAVATKLMIEQIDKIIYQHIDDMEEDTMRFVRDCEAWFGKPIEIRQSPYKSVNNVCLAMSFVNSPGGPVCSRLLKRRDRKEWEAEHRFFCNFRYVWGMDESKRERGRAERIRNDMREDEHVFPLQDRGLTKADAHGILREAGIARPRMYDRGFPNNNCKVCVRGGAGYMNLCRKEFPEEFAARAAMERRIGATCLKQDLKDPDAPLDEFNTHKLYLDELDPEAGRDCEIIVPECGAMCEAMSISNAANEPRSDSK